MKSMMKKAGLGFALAATALSVAAPAEAQRYYGRYRNDNGGAAVVAGIAGLAIGAAIASNNNNRYQTQETRLLLLGLEKKMPPELIPLTAQQHAVTRLPKFTTELPFFYLTKQTAARSKPIHFQTTDAQGKPVTWQVKPNDTVGIPGIEAHEV